MNNTNNPLTDQVLALYREPAIGSSYRNTYGEENIRTLVEKYRALDESAMATMLDMVVDFSKSPDLASSFISVGVLHAIGKKQEVEQAYLWAKTQNEASSYISHFDIGKSLAEYFT